MGGVGLESPRLGIPSVSALKSVVLGEEWYSSGEFLLVCSRC